MSRALKSKSIRLVSSAGTGFFYQTTKNAMKTPTKLVLMKHDPIVNKHVLFVETKVSKGQAKHKKSGHGG